MYAATAISRKSFAAQNAAVIMIIVLLLAAMPASIVSAAETGFFAPSTVTIGGKGWVNPTNVRFSDNQYATASANKAMRLSQFHISPIAGDASIDGIAVEVEGKTAGGRQVKVQMSGDGGVTWSTALTTDLTASEGVHTLGGPSSLWGLTWSPAQFADGSFVMRVTASGTRTSGTVYVDQVRVKVFYTPNAVQITVKADPQTKHYGYPEPVYTYQVTEGALLPGDSFSGALVRAPGDAPGLYEIGQGNLTAGPGYVITYVPDFLTIDKAPLTVTAQSYWKLSGDPDITTFAYHYTGFVLGEDESVLTSLPTCSLPGGTDQTAPGVYPITCTGAAAANYDISYVDGSLTVKTFNNTPSDVTLTPSTLEENHLAGYTVGTLGTNDPDPDPFTYSFCGGADDASFTIEGDLLKTAARLDYETKNGYSICVAVADGFGGAASKTLGVTVTDLPETFLSVGSQDGWVLESGEATNVGGTLNATGVTLRLGDDAANRQYRSILSFATGSLPDNAVITQMTLKIRRTPTIVGRNPFLTHGNILVDGKTGFFGTSSLLRIADFQAAATKAKWRMITNSPSRGWYSTTLSAANIMLINRAGPTQMRLRFQRDDNNDFGADYLSFYGGNAALSRRPVLEVQYYLP